MLLSKGVSHIRSRRRNTLLPGVIKRKYIIIQPALELKLLNSNGNLENHCNLLFDFKNADA